jgi:hypothetical protein
MDKSGVNYSVRSNCAAAKAFEIFERTAMCFGSCRDKGFGCSIRASKAENLMTGINQFSNDCRTDEASSSGDKNTHILFLLSIL